MWTVNPDQILQVMASALGLHCFLLLLYCCFTSKVMSVLSINLTTFFLGRLRPPQPLTSTSCTLSASDWQLPFLNQRKGKWRYVARPGIKPRTPDWWIGCLPTGCTVCVCPQNGYQVSQFLAPPPLDSLPLGYTSLKKVNWSRMSSWLNTWTEYQVGLCFDQIILYNCMARQCSLLRRKFTVIYNQSSSIAFDETSSYWSAPKN